MGNKKPYVALGYREFNLFLVVRFALVFAWSMQFIIIEWQVYSITEDPIYLGLIGLVEIVPALGMALFAGYLVDKWEKRRLLTKCLIAFTFLNTGLFLLTWPLVTDGISQNYILIGIYVLVFLGGIVRAFVGPTIFSLLGLVVPKTVYANAAVWSSSVWQFGNVMGAAIAGLSIHLIGVHWSMSLIVFFSLLALVVLRKIEAKPILNKKAGEPMIKSLKEGLRYVYTSKAILGAFSLDMVAVLFGGAVALLPIFAQDILKVGPEGFGVLRAAPAVGALLTVLITAYLPIAKNAGLKLLFAIFGFGLCIIAFGFSTIYWVSVLALFFSGVTDGISVVIRQTILQLKAPDEMRGRIASVNSMFVGSSNELGAFESGVTAKFMGAVGAVVFGGTMTIFTVITTGLISPTFRKLDLTEDADKNSGI